MYDGSDVNGSMGGARVFVGLQNPTIGTRPT